MEALLFVPLPFNCAASPAYKATSLAILWAGKVATGPPVVDRMMGRKPCGTLLFAMMLASNSYEISLPHLERRPWESEGEPRPGVLAEQFWTRLLRAAVLP